MRKINKESLYKYTVAEDVANAITHGVGALLAYIGTLYLVNVASLKGDKLDVIAFAIYGTSITLLFLMSCLYHAIFQDETRSVFKRLDHSTIFLMIWGSYLPYTVVLGTQKAYIIMGIITILSIVGIILKVLFVGQYNKLATVIYVLLGWSAVFEFQDMMNVFSMQAMTYLVLGGVIYTVGAIIYACSNFKYHHAVWHMFVLVAAACHFISISQYLL